MVATTSPAPSPLSSARTPALVADSVRLRSIERFARRKATEDRTNSPRRRAQVSDLRRHSVCGTGVAEKRRLGDASKAKIETLVAIGAQHPDAFGLPGASPGVRECADSVQGALYHSGSFENRGARMDYAANDRSSIARLGVSAEGVLDSHPAKPALAHLAPAARPLPLEPGWTLAGKEREAMQGAGSPSAIREEAAFAAAALPSGARRRLDSAASASATAAPKRESLPRWDTDAFGDSAFDAAALEAARGGDAGFAKVAAAGREGTVPVGPSGRPGGDGDGEKGGRGRGRGRVGFGDASRRRGRGADAESGGAKGALRGGGAGARRGVDATAVPAGGRREAQGEHRHRRVKGETVRPAARVFNVRPPPGSSSLLATTPTFESKSKYSSPSSRRERRSPSSWLRSRLPPARSRAPLEREGARPRGEGHGFPRRCPLAGTPRSRASAPSGAASAPLGSATRPSGGAPRCRRARGATPRASTRRWRARSRTSRRARTRRFASRARPRAAGPRARRGGRRAPRAGRDRRRRRARAFPSRRRPPRRV